MENREMLDQCMKDAISELVSALREKSRGYGPIEPPELVPQMSVLDSLLVRLSDKIRRLRNLRAQPIEAVTESLDDTILDIAGYCMLYRGYKAFQEGGDDK